MRKEFESVLLKLKKWENGGDRTLENGSRLICHVPHIAPQAWLHKVYAGLQDDNINEIKEKIGIELPSDYCEFLTYSNGINIFSDSLSVWGLRTSYARTGDAAVQPYDIIELNKEKRGKIQSNCLVFGSYSWDGSEMLYNLENDNTKVYRCENSSTKVLQEWETIWIWLYSEVDRIGKLFDTNGIQYNDNIPTISSD